MSGRSEADVLILGGGPVGLILALALARGPRRVIVADGAPAGAAAGDPRALALSHGTRQLLESLGAWNGQAATPIEEIHISQGQGFGRTLMRASDHGIAGLGYVMPYGELASALAGRLGALPGVSVLTSTRFVSRRVEAGGAVATLERDGQPLEIAARLLVHAEGSPGKEPGVTVRDYRQQAVVAQVEVREGHGSRAWEFFTADGPLALLPSRQGYAVVFTLSPEQAAALMALDEAGFLAALQSRFGGRLTFTAAGPRGCFPLALRLRDQVVGPREVWVGNAAQTLHPVSGQGFNLGLRDAWELALAIGREGDPGCLPALQAYARGRMADRWGSALFTHGVVRLFSNSNGPLRLARGLGLLALDIFPPARRFVARRMIWGGRSQP